MSEQAGSSRPGHTTKVAQTSYSRSGRFSLCDRAGPVEPVGPVELVGPVEPVELSFFMKKPSTAYSYGGRFFFMKNLDP